MCFEDLSGLLLYKGFHFTFGWNSAVLLFKLIYIRKTSNISGHTIMIVDGVFPHLYGSHYEIYKYIYIPLSYRGRMLSLIHLGQCIDCHVYHTICIQCI
jgi:hypothetical protein